eukprot:scaffold113575_cov55-Attheya_sp.AAC.1
MALYCGAHIGILQTSQTIGRASNSPSLLPIPQAESKKPETDMIMKALVQGLVIAKSVPDLQHNFHNEPHATASFFFGERSLLTTVNLAVCVTHVQNHFQIYYEELQAKDSSFVAQQDVIYSTSIRIQNWFQECIQKEIRGNGDD